MSLSLKLFLLVMMQLACESVCQPMVCSNAGCMQGIHIPGYQTTTHFEAFLGIPYAQAPVGHLRFSNPRSYMPWQGILNTSTAKSDCIQKNYLLPHKPIYGEEDCLYMNVYRPIKYTNHTRNPLPVMIYIHGGGWFTGSSNPHVLGPEYFMDTKEVILVTFNYRLGPFGFLSTNDRQMSGNFGLKDQNLALRWVQKNIAAFGGSPHQVTLFGHSAGSVSTHMHMLSKQSEGLFHKAILLSGTSNVPFAITTDPLNQTRKLANICQTMSSAKLTRALRHVDAKDLLNRGDELKYWDVDPLVNFRPVVEADNLEDAFFTENPQNILKKGSYKMVPTLMSTVPVEGGVRVLAIIENQRLKDDFNKKFHFLLEELLELPSNLDGRQRKNILKFAIDEYFHGQTEINNATAQGFLDLISDRGFLVPLLNTIENYLNHENITQNPLYLLRFNFKGSHTFAKVFTGRQQLQRNYGVIHCDELLYLFRMPIIFSDFDKNSIEAEMIKSLVENFVHFAKYGKPQNSDELRSCKKEQINQSLHEFCDFQEYSNEPTGNNIKINNKLNTQRLKMWNDLLSM